MSQYRNTHHCRRCKKGSSLYSDAHGIFCRNCGPSVPVDTGVWFGDGTVTFPNGAVYPTKGFVMHVTEETPDGR